MEFNFHKVGDCDWVCGDLRYILSLPVQKQSEFVAICVIFPRYPFRNSIRPLESYNRGDLRIVQNEEFKRLNVSRRRLILGSVMRSRLPYLIMLCANIIMALSSYLRALCWVVILAQDLANADNSRRHQQSSSSSSSSSSTCSSSSNLAWLLSLSLDVNAICSVLVASPSKWPHALPQLSCHALSLTQYVLSHGECTTGCNCCLVGCACIICVGRCLDL